MKSFIWVTMSFLLLTSCGTLCGKKSSRTPQSVSTSNYVAFTMHRSQVDRIVDLMRSFSLDAERVPTPSEWLEKMIYLDIDAVPLTLDDLISLSKEKSVFADVNDTVKEGPFYAASIGTHMTPFANILGHIHGGSVMALVGGGFAFLGVVVGGEILDERLNGFIPGDRTPTTKFQKRLNKINKKIRSNTVAKRAGFSLASLGVLALLSGVLGSDDWGEANAVTVIIDRNATKEIFKL